ncbi:MAG TPA: AEC family transporter [Clostridiaceae bacterium]|nr:AEC family transporter [Clostridiaceae bacterium]
MYIYTILSLLFRIFVLVGLGLFLKKINLIDDKIQQGLSKLLVNVFLPASVLVSASNPFEAEMVNEIIVTGIVSLIYFGLISLLFIFVLRKIPFKMSKDKQNVFSVLIIYANTAFLGYPLTENLLGSKAIILGVIHNILWSLFFFTIGISIIKGESSVKFLSIIKNPVTISAILTLIIYLSPSRLPAIINTVLTDIGNLVTPLSMMLVGATLSGTTLKALLRDPYSILVAVFRLLIIPISAIFLLKIFNIPELAYKTLIIMLALPSGSMVAIHASLFNKEADFAASSVSLNTALFAVTFPLILFLMNL